MRSPAVPTASSDATSRTSSPLVGGSAPDQTDLHAALLTLRSAARRTAVARRFVPDVERQLLQSIVDATVRLFDAEAASIALFERDPDRLEFRVAAGPRGAGAVGLSVPPSHGIVGYVYATAQALALSDVAADPRFDRAAAERSGYVPRSIAAVPLLDGEDAVGVLQVLDKREAPSFTLRDMELLGVFAAQAGAAIAAIRIQREAPAVIASALRQLAGDDLGPDAIDALVSAATLDLDGEAAQPFWRVVDQVSRLHGLGARELDLVSAMLSAVLGSAEAERAANARPHRTRH